MRKPRAPKPKNLPEPVRLSTDPTPEETDAWRAIFLRELAKWGVAVHAAKEAGVSIRTANRHRAKDPEFAEAWEEARGAIVATMEVVARQRALVGVRTPVIYQGKIVEHINEVDSGMLRWMLAKLKPEVYGDKAEISHKHEGEVGLNVSGAIDITLCTDDELRTLDEILERTLARGGQDGAGEEEPAPVRAPGVGARRS